MDCGALMRLNADCGGCLLHYAALLDTSFLAGKIAKIVELGATHLAILVDCDRVDKRRLDGEDTLYTDVIADLANGETFLVALARDADNNTTVLLDTFLVTLLDTVSHGDGVAGTEIGVLLAGGKCLFGYFD